jgi:predicted NUDIX family NTP pyrophosphohydrolase
LSIPAGRYGPTRDAGAWSIPKGEVRAGEDNLAAAKREFEEELGFPPHGEFVALGELTQKGGKTVHAFGIPRRL